MKSFHLFSLILNLITAQSTNNLQLTQTISTFNPKSTISYTNQVTTTIQPQITKISTQSTSNPSISNSISSQLQSTGFSTQYTSILPQTSIKPSQPQPTTLQTPDNLTTTTQNPDLPTHNPQSPSRPWDCSKFRITYLPQNCCSLPKIQISHQITEKCKNDCKNRHCCIVECKYRESGIYKDKEFHDQALLTAFKNSLGSDTEKQNWAIPMNLSLEFCESLIMSVTTLGTTTTKMKKGIVTMTTSSKAKAAELKGKKQQADATKPVELTSTTLFVSSISTATGNTTSTTTMSTESIKDRRDKNLYCNIPVYVYLMISCTKVQNFINCPNFKANDEVCDEWRDFLRKCRYELGFQL